MATRTWLGTIGSDWNAAANWSGNGVPGSGDTALILPSSFTPSLTGATLTAETIDLAAPAGGIPRAILTDVTLAAGSLVTTDAGTDSPALAIGGGGTLTVAAGATVQADGTGTSFGQVFSLGDDSGNATLVNNGLIEATNNSNLHLNAWNGGVVNNGTIAAFGGEVQFGFVTGVHSTIAESPPTKLDGSGVVEIGNAGTVWFNATLDSGTLRFDDGTGLLFLSRTDTTKPIPAFAGGSVSGFQAGDKIDLFGTPANGLSFSGNTLTVVENGTPVVAIPFSGSYSATDFALAPDGLGGSLVTELAPGAPPALGVPPSESVTPSGAVVVRPLSYTDSFAAGNPGAMFLSISDDVGTLTALDASGATLAGSGTQSIILNGSYTQVATALNTLHYIAPATPGSDTIRFDVWNQAGVETMGAIPVAIGSGSGSDAPSISAPASEQVGINQMLAVSGVSIHDSFAAGNPGAAFLHVSDASGALSLAGSTGNETNSATLTGSLATLNSALTGLAYTAGTNAGFDTMRIDFWDQAGTEVTRGIPVTISASELPGAPTLSAGTTMTTQAATMFAGSTTSAEITPAKLLLPHI
jgi:hypothetical protein